MATSETKSFLSQTHHDAVVYWGSDDGDGNALSVILSLYSTLLYSQLPTLYSHTDRQHTMCKRRKAQHSPRSYIRNIDQTNKTKSTE